MTIWQKIKDFFDVDDSKKNEPAIIFGERVPEQSEVTTNPDNVENVATQPAKPYNPYTKFQAEFHNPRLECFGCKSSIEEGKVRFMNVSGKEETFHKSCLKKMKSGRMP